jgi:DNA-directed RNA polymerase subunit beta'
VQFNLEAMQTRPESSGVTLEKSFPLLETAAASSAVGAALEASTTEYLGGMHHPGILDGYSDNVQFAQDAYDGSATASGFAEQNYRVPSSHPDITSYQDDLTIIAGINHAVAEMLHSYGINKFADLAGTNPDQLRQILATDFPMYDPSTWPDQALMASTGDWDGLRAWQEQLINELPVASVGDDLTRIEGIGEKIASVLASKGVDSFVELARRQPAEIAEMLGPSMVMHDPTTWPKQAQMAASGQWDELRAWQAELDGGRLTATFADDLTVVEGIGPKVAELLNSFGIFTWNHLAATSVEQIREYLGHAGGQFLVHDPTTWPQQAQMAADGLFEELRAWQEQLSGGRL